MKRNTRAITAAMAHRTREALTARKALCAAATIHTTTIVILLACLVIPFHAVVA